MDLGRAGWSKSTRSSGGGSGDCVEVARTPEVVGVRDSKNRGDGHIALSPASWSAFLDGVKGGDFDLR
jgi:hypothetical protein